MYVTSSDSIVINKIEDILLIELRDGNPKETVYSIQSENEKVVRKGRFSGQLIQLCLSHLASGYYKLFLSREDDVITYPFEKQNSQFVSLSR